MQAQNLLWKSAVVISLPLALGFALASYLRKARAVHARGLTVKAHVAAPLDQPSYLKPLADRLKSEALLRFSNTIWKSPATHWDLLGCAIRFNWNEAEGDAIKAHHQDLILASVQHLWTLPFAFFSTKANSFFANQYYSLTPFYVRGLGKVFFRLRVKEPIKQVSVAADREQELIEQSRKQQAKFVLEVKGQLNQEIWQPLIDLVLMAPVNIDQNALSFHPGNAGSGIEPVGFLNGLRRFTYGFSVAGRRLANANKIQLRSKEGDFVLI